MSHHVQDTYQLLEENDHYLLVTHLKPDGDAWGSLVGLHQWLVNAGKDVVSLVTEQDLAHLQYMHSIIPITEISSQQLPADWAERKLICLDLAGLGRAGFPLPNDFEVWMNIDHHPDNPEYAEHNLILSDYPATAQILHTVFSCGPEHFVDDTAGTALAVGLLTDTLFMSIPKTNMGSYMMCAQLLQQGIHIPKLSLQLQKEVSVNEFNAQCDILSKARFSHSQQIATVIVRRHELDKHGLDRAHTHNILKFLRQIQGLVVSLVMIEEPGENGKFRCSLRSDDEHVAINDIAKSYDGGGHAQAAGFILQLEPMDIDEQIERVAEQIESRIATKL